MHYTHTYKIDFHNVSSPYLLKPSYSLDLFSSMMLDMVLAEFSYIKAIYIKST